MDPPLAAKWQQNFLSFCFSAYHHQFFAIKKPAFQRAFFKSSYVIGRPYQDAAGRSLSYLGY